MRHRGSVVEAMAEVEPKYMTTKEAARYLRVSRNWLYLRASDRTVPCVRLGRLVRFLKEDLDRWAASTVTGPKKARRS
jgi:excisionase family DNA binding protein